MKKIIIYILFAIFSIDCFGQEENNVQYHSCTNCSTNPVYTLPVADGEPEEFRLTGTGALEFVSDFGRRRGNNSQWHRGIDLNVIDLVDGSDLGYHLLSINTGTIQAIAYNAVDKYKVVSILGDDGITYGYGHVFSDNTLLTFDRNLSRYLLSRPKVANWLEVIKNNLKNHFLGNTLVDKFGFTDNIDLNNAFGTNPHFTDNNEIGNVEFTLLGGTQGFEIVITDIEVSCASDNPVTTIKFKCYLWDTFGSDTGDLVGLKQTSDGLASMFILQHFRNDENQNLIPQYIPFFHLVEFRSHVTF